MHSPIPSRHSFWTGFNSPQVAALFAAACALLAGPAGADTLTLLPTHDATLYENSFGDLASGSGPTFFVGRANIGFEDIRRGLLRFDVAGNLPPGAVVTGAELRLYLSRTISSNVTIELHRVTQDWGEGSSNAGVNGGSGASAADGDATWLYTFYSPTSPPIWTRSGGDFSSTPSGSTVVGFALGYYSWASTPQMVADVQGWLDTPGGNFGWLLKDDETVSGTAKRFDSREAAASVPDTRPKLIISYTPAVVAAEPASWSRVKALYR